MAINDLTGKNIQDTYQKVIQTDGANVADGTGSLLPISFDGNNVIISGSLTATEYSVTSSVTNVVFQQQSGSTIFGDSQDDTHLFTGSLKVSGTIESVNKSTVNRVGGTYAGFYINNLLYLGYPDTGTHVRIGNPSYAVTMSAAAVNIDSAMEVTIDSNAGVVYFADSGATSVLIHTTHGYISASGYITTGQHITASGNISASGNVIASTLTGNIDGGSF